MFRGDVVRSVGRLGLVYYRLVQVERYLILGVSIRVGKMGEVISGEVGGGKRFRCWEGERITLGSVVSFCKQ